MYSFGRDRIHSSENIVTTIRSDCTNHSNRNIVRSFRVGTNCKSRSPELHARDRKTAQIKAIQMKSFSCWTIRSREGPNGLDGQHLIGVAYVQGRVQLHVGLPAGSKVAPLKQRGRSGSNSRVRAQGRPELKIHSEAGCRCKAHCLSTPRQGAASCVAPFFRP
jgi:hypothetical protein